MVARWHPPMFPKRSGTTCAASTCGKLVMQVEPVPVGNKGWAVVARTVTGGGAEEEDDEEEEDICSASLSNWRCLTLV